MLKKILLIAIMAIASLGTWADGEVSNKTLWTFDNYTGQDASVYDLNSLYLHSSETSSAFTDFAAVTEHAKTLSGTFTGATQWVATKILESSKGCDLSALGNIDASSTSGADGSLAFNYSKSGRLYIVYGATTTTNGTFNVMQKPTGETSYTSVYSETMEGMAYNGGLNVPPANRANGYTYTQQEAIVSLSGSGTVYLGGSQPYCIYAILYLPDSYGTYDFQTWAEANISKNAQSIIVLDENGYMTGQFTPSTSGETITGTMTLNDVFSITGDEASKYKLRRNGTTGDNNSGLMIANTSEAMLTLNRLQAGDWFSIKTNTGGRLAFATANGNIHKAGSNETITQDAYVESEAIYLVTASTQVDLYNKASGAVYIHSIQISNEDAVSAPVITVDGSNQVSIDGGTSLKGDAVKVYYTTDNTDPKTSDTRQTYTDPFTPTETVKIRAYSVLASDESVVSAEATPAVVRIGTWTGEQNVFDFASAAANFVDITFGEPAVEGIKYYSSSTSQDAEGTFYPISNTDWLTASTGNTAVVSWRNGTGNAAFENGGLKWKSQRYFAVSGLTTGQRVKILFDGQLRYRTNVANGAPVMQYNGEDVAVETTYGSSTATNTEIILTVKSGSYLVFYCNTSNDVIKRIAVLAPIPTYTLTVNYETAKGNVTNGDEALAETYQEGTVVSLKATPTEGYQFAEWTDEDNHRLSLKNPYDVTIDSNTTINAVFKQPTSPATAITTETTWTFDGLTAGTNLSGTQVYELDGLYISGHNPSGSNPAKVVAGTSTTDTQIAGEVTNYVQFAGGSTSSLASKEVTDYATDKAAFKVGTPGTVSVFTGAAADRKIIIEVNGATKQNQYSDLALGLQTRDVTETSNVFIGTTTGAGYIYAIKFTPEMVTAPQINVDNHVGTIAAGTSNLTETANKVIKTYYTIDDTEPTSESLLYEGIIMASGTNITVKAISINTITGTKSEVTTATGLTLQLPVVTFSATATNGTVAWKKAGTTDAQADNYEKGTTIEVTATPANGYMFQSWTKGDEVVAKTPTYTFTLMENTALVAHFKSIGNTVPVILVAGQSNTDGRIDASELPASFTGLAHCLWSYANAKASPAGTFNNKVWEIGDFVNYTPTSDTGTQWAYDAAVYDQIGKQLGTDFYVIKQSKGNTGISPASGGCGLFWSANPLWMSRTASANEGGLSLLKALTDHIDASLERIPSGKTADIKFLMWHQGEGDGNGSQGAVYYTQLKAVINHVRNHLAAKNAKYSNLPFILGGITSSSAQYREEVEAAKQQLASEDANIYYVSADEIGTDGLKNDVLHFNAAGAQTLGNKVWQTIYENNLLLGLEDGTGSSTPVADILEESEPISTTTSWNFSGKEEGTAYAEKTDINGLYLHGSSSNKMTVKSTDVTSVTYYDGEEVTTSKAVRSASGDRSKFMTYGLTAGDVVAVDRMIGVNTGTEGTFYAVIAPETQPTTEQSAREIYLLFNGEKVATINALEAWNASDDHTVKLKYTADKAGTFFLTGQHPYLLYAAKFVKAGEETGGFTITAVAEGGTITMTAPEGKTLNSTFSKGEEVTLKVTAEEGYEFVRWTDADNQSLGTSETLTITVDSDVTIHAVFKAKLKPVVFQFATAAGNSEVLSFDATALSIVENDGNKNSSRSDYYRMTNNSTELPSNGKLSWRVPAGKSNPTLESGGIKGNSYPLAIHNLSEGDEIALLYSGGTMKNYTPTTADAITANGVDVEAGETIASGQILSIKSVSAENNYIVLYLDNKTVISAIYINSELPEEYANNLYVSPNGNDNNTGKSKSSPFRTLKKAQEMVASGQTIHILPGTYQVTNDEYMDQTDNTWNVVYQLNKDNVQYLGEPDADGNRPVFDFSSVTTVDNKRITGFHLAATDLVIKNIETIGIKAAPVSGTQSENFRLNGATNCQLVNIAAHDGEGIGFYVHRASAGNMIQDCDAYNNFDATNHDGGNNDGFGCHVSAGYEGNKFVNCRAWNNADDGFDLKSCFSKVVIEGCIAYKNGFDADGNKQADGNGFKAGGFGKQAITLPSGGSPMHEVNNSIAAENKAAGFYSNHHLGGLQFEGNRAYHNSIDYRMTNRDMASISKNIDNATDPEMNVDGYGHLLINNLSYKTTTVISDIDAAQCTMAGNSFTYASGSWVNESYDNSDFESVDLNLLTQPRNADGHLPADVFGFMQLKEVGDIPAAPSCTEVSKVIGKVTYSILYPEDAELHYILPESEEMTTQEGTVVNGKKNYTIEVSVSGEMKLYSQKGKKASDIVKVNVVVPQPTPAVTYQLKQMYKDGVVLNMNDETKTTRYFGQKTDAGTLEDKTGNFYDIEASPINSNISWREKNVELTAEGLKPTSEARPFAIHNLMEGDVIRIEFSGDIYYAKHSTKGDTLKDIAPGDAITSMTAYTVSAIDEENGYVMFYPTKATTISQISINEELASTKASKPTISEPTENPDGTKSYTVTINKGETLHYTAPDKEGEQTVNYQETDEGSYVITVTQSGSLTCWTTLEGDTEKSAETKVLVTFAADEPTEKITVHTIGDSTMSSYDQNIPAQKGMDGWGSYLGDCLKSDWATVYNWADRGEGAKSYYNGIWLKTSTDRPEFGEPVMNKVKAGDYVIIQFGHNDSKAYSTEVYEEWMGKLVDAVKEKGATPIIASSICRRRFNADGTISLLGQINSIEDAAGRVPKESVTGDEHEYDYPYHARMVAQAKGIEFIDVTAGTKALYERYGDEKSQAFFPYGEKTHTNQLGAQTIAKVVAQILFENNTALKKYVDIAQLELPDADTIEVVKIVDNFKDEATVTSKRTWTFNDYEAGTVIANQVTNLNGMYARGHAEATIDAVNATPVTKVTFSDDNQTSVLVSRAAKVGANSSGANTIGLNTAGRADASALRNTFAFNITTPGTFYAVMAPQEEAAGKNMRLLFSGVEKDVKPVNEVYANDQHLCELSYHAETTGVIYLSAGAPTHLYAAMFVPDMEKGTEEDWNYQMVLTRDAGLWTYTNLSGSNQSVPEGLTVYAVSAIDSEGNATLADIGHVIPQHQGFLVKGKANTEYALPATTEEETYKGSNLLVGNATLRFLPATEDGKTNYWFDGTKFVKATGNETIHEKQAYLSAAVAMDEVQLEIPEPIVKNAEVTLKDDTRKDRKVYQVVFGENQKFYYLRPGQDTEPRSQSYKAEFAENPFTVTVSNNGDFIYWTKETIDKVEYESEHNTIVVNTIARKPTATYSKVIGGESVYQLAFTKGTSLYYKIGDSAEQAVASGDTISVRVAKTGMLTAYSKNSYVVSDTLSTRVYAPAPAIAKDSIYDFALLKDVIGADYTLASIGYEGTVTVGQTTLNTPNALTAKALDIFAFSAPTSEGTESSDWRLLNAGRLRAAKSDNDKHMAILGVRKGQYLTITYSGASIRYSTKGTASMVEGTDTLKSKQCYEITGDGDLLLTIPADSLLNCDITVISLSSDETVTEPRFTAVEGRADQVKLTPGTSSFGKKVKAYYTTDGSIPTTESTMIEKSTTITADSTCVVKAYSVSETGKASAVVSYSLVVSEVDVENAVVTLKDDSRKDRKVYQAVFGQNQKFYYLRPGQDTEPRSQSYKAEFTENPFTVTVSNNGDFIYWLQETVNGHIYESRHDTIVVNSIAKKPTSTLSRVEGEVAYYTVTFTEGTALHYTLDDGQETVVATGTTAEVPVTTSCKMKAWSENEQVVSDVLTVTLFAPTPPPSEDGEVDFSEASEDLPSDLEVTLDMEQAVRVDGETLYKPSALTAATFNDRFAFSELTTSKKITITTKHQLTFAKGDDVKMAILGLSAGDIVAFDFTGRIQISDPTMLKLGQPNNSAPMRAADTAEEMMISEASYEVVRDGDVLLNVLLADESMKISRMYIAAKPSLSAPATIQFSEAAEEYEALEYGKTTSVYYKGKSSAQTFYRITNNQEILPIVGKLSAEAAAGEIVTNGLRTNGSRIAIHNVARGDVIMVHYQTGAVTYAGHDEKGCRVRIGDHVLEAGDTIHSGDIVVVNQVDYLNNYVVLRLDSKALVSGLFINSEGVESISIPTIVDKGKNTIQITGGKSSTGMNVTTIYTTDGSDPTEENGTCADGSYETFEVKLLQGGMVTIKAVTVSETGIASPVATLIVNADHLVYGPSFLMDENGNMYDVYNAWGQKVNAVRRGQLYIVNGKKIVYK